MPDLQKFDRKNDKIAVVVNDFTLKKKSDIFFDRYSEPYITSIAIDKAGAANPTYSTAITVIQKVSELVVEKLQRNKDDELFRRNGTLLQGSAPPFDIGRTYTSENDFIRTNIKIIPLDISNNLGAQTREIKLE